MVLLPTKTPTFISIVGLAVFLTILNSCKTLTYDPLRRYADDQNKNKRLDHIRAFNDVGFVQVEVSEKHYVVRGNQVFVEEPYGDSDPQLRMSIPINVQTDDFSDNPAGLITSDTVSSTSSDLDDVENLPPDLQELSFETLRLHNLSSHTFKWLSSISVTSLNMRYTDIEHVAEDTLEPVQSTLQILDLSHATISMKDLRALMQGLHNNTIEDRSSNLIILSLAHLGLRRIPHEVLSPVQYSLQALSLFGNNFHTARKMDMYLADDYEEDEFDFVAKPVRNYFSNLREKSNDSTGSFWAAFPHMPSLIELDLRQCDINFVGRGSFKNLANLRNLYISENNILVLPNFAFEGLTNLVTLDMSFNRFKIRDTLYGLKLSGNSFGELFSLRIMNLSFTAIHPKSTQFLRNLPTSLITLELRASNLSHLADGIFRRLSSLQVLNLSNNFGLASDPANAIFMGLDMLQELYMAVTSLASLKPLEELSSLRLLDVRGNNLASFENVLTKFPLLEYLDISSNYIHPWRDDRAFAGNSKLQGVYLHFNILSLMSAEMREDFQSLSYLTLAHNNFVCNCELKYFMEYLIDMNNNTLKNLPVLIDYQSNGTTHVCTDATLSITVGFADTDAFCVAALADYWLSALQHGIYISVLVFVCFLSLGGLIYRKWWYIRYVAVLLKNATVLSMINVENCEDRIYMYDVFVSYSDANRNWVIEELLPNIEGPEARLTICLHERDFQVGVSILENIITGMDQSRTILLIISGCFIKSQWCQFEMHMAQHRLLETCREELLLILLEEIPRRKRPKTLHYLMMVKTYIVWPKDSDNSSAKKLFWKRLRRAITANKSKHSSVV